MKAKKFIKRRLPFVCMTLLMITNIVTGCNSNNANPSSITNDNKIPTEVSTESPRLDSQTVYEDKSNIDKEEKIVTNVGKCDGNIILKHANVYQFSNRAEIDLDGDGSIDSVEITENGKYMVINEIRYPIEDENTKFPEAKFTIIDFNTMDSYIEIAALSEDDFELGACDMIMFRYKDENLICIGGLNADMLSGEVSFDGMNHMYQSNYKIEMQESNFITAQYTINEEEKFEMIYPEEGYYYQSYERHTCKLLENLPVYTDRNRKSEPYMIKPQTVRFRRTDAKNWVEVVAEDGTSGWMYLEEGYFIIDLNKHTEEVFEGLWFAG